MSVYAGAVQQGTQAAILAIDGENAGTRAAAAAAYNAAARRSAARRAAYLAQLNIAAIKQDKILNDTKIREQQDIAQAAAKVRAAAAGVEGGVVRDIETDIDRTGAYERQANVIREEHQIEDQLEEVRTQSLAHDAVRDPVFGTTASAIIGAVGQIEVNDFRTANELWGGDDAPATATAKQGSN